MMAATHCERLLRDARCGWNGWAPQAIATAGLPAFPSAGAPRQSLQAGLLERGQARVSARIGDKACADGLLTIERAARAARRGLWADPNFAPLQAENLLRLQAERGHFALVEGKVLSVRESGATIYVNFGR